MRCDTCGRDVPEVRRVVVAPGYDRTLAKPIYNCPECYEKKEKAKNIIYLKARQTCLKAKRKDKGNGPD